MQTNPNKVKERALLDF